MLREHGNTAAKSLQSCLTLCNPIDCSPPDSPVPGILQARTMQWVVISFFNAWKWKVKEKLLSRVRLLATPWTVAHQAPPSMRFSRQEYCNGVPLPSLIALTRRTFVGKVIALLFNMLSRLVIGEGNGNPLQYSCLENLMDGGAWWATVHGVAKSQTQLSDFTFHLGWS